MTLVFALAAATLFGTGAYLLLDRDLVRVVLGVVLISQAAVLTLIASGLTRGAAPIYPLTERDISDPLSQAHGAHGDRHRPRGHRAAARARAARGPGVRDPRARRHRRRTRPSATPRSSASTRAEHEDEEAAAR